MPNYRGVNQYTKDESRTKASQVDQNNCGTDIMDYGNVEPIESMNYNEDYPPFEGQGESEVLDQSEHSGEVSEEFIHGIEDHGTWFRIKDHCHCTFCCEDFDDKSKFLVHGDCYFIRRQVEALNSGVEQQSLGTFGRQNTWIFQCELCEKVSSVQTELRRHMASHFPRALCCKSCDFRSATLANLKTHLRKVHKLDC